VRIVQTLVVRGDAEIVDAQIAFHLNAGVDFVVAADHESRDGTREVLEAYVREGVLRVIAGDGEARESVRRTQMARLAASEHGAEWVVNSDAGEFWLPRGDGLEDVLVAIPPRYAVVQALVREFVRRPGDGFFAERMTMRHGVPATPPDDASTLLRQVHRADPEIVLDDRGRVTDARQRLRAWYPIEVLTFPATSAGAAADEEQVSAGLADRSLVVDERLRDLLRALERPGGAHADRAFALPSELARGVQFPVPDIVDDAAYAGECAAVGEVDIERLDEQILELRARLDRLEQRLWPRVRRRAAGAVRRAANRRR
jgi:hypothetical protein